MSPTQANGIKSIFGQITAKRNNTEDTSTLFEEIPFTEANRILVAMSAQNKKAIAKKGKRSFM
jgi:hypothetical protein